MMQDLHNIWYDKYSINEKKTIMTLKYSSYTENQMIYD